MLPNPEHVGLPRPHPHSIDKKYYLALLTPMKIFTLFIASHAPNRKKRKNEKKNRRLGTGIAGGKNASRRYMFS